MKFWKKSSSLRSFVKSQLNMWRWYVKEQITSIRQLDQFEFVKTLKTLSKWTLGSYMIASAYKSTDLLCLQLCYDVKASETLCIISLSKLQHVMHKGVVNLGFQGRLLMKSKFIPCIFFQEKYKFIQCIFLMINSTISNALIKT